MLLDLVMYLVVLQWSASWFQLISFSEYLLFCSYREQGYSRFPKNDLYYQPNNSSILIMSNTQPGTVIIISSFIGTYGVYNVVTIIIYFYSLFLLCILFAQSALIIRDCSII